MQILLLFHYLTEKNIISSLTSGITHHRNSEILFTAGRGHCMLEIDAGNFQHLLSPGTVLP